MVNISLASASLDASFMPSSVTNMCVTASTAAPEALLNLTTLVSFSYDRTLRNSALSAVPSDVFADRHDVLKFL